MVVEIGQKPEVSLLNAHQIRISDIFPGSENLIFPMLFYTDSHVRDVRPLNWNSHTWSSSDVIFSSSDIIISCCIPVYSEAYGNLFHYENAVLNGEQEKKSISLFM